MSAPIQFSPPICEAVDAWHAAEKMRVRAVQELERCNEQSKQAGITLARLMVPNDAKEDEVFNLWIGGTLVQCWGTQGPSGMEYHTRNRES